MKIRLQQPLLPEASRPEAARRLGITADDLQRLLHGEVAYSDGRCWEYDDFRKAFHEGDFYHNTGVAVLPDAVLVNEIDVGRDVRLRLDPPISTEELNGVRVLLLQSFLEKLKEFNAPAVLIANTRRMLQVAFDAPLAPTWSPTSALMTGSAAKAGVHGVPQPVGPDICGSSRSGSTPVDCAFLGASMLIQFPFASLVVAADGEIRDAFPTCGMRAVASDGRRTLFVQGGGGASWSGYFGAQCFARDMDARKWLEGDLPDSLPPYVAGTIGDLKWSVVVNVAQGMGYRLSPFSESDMCGHAFNSACGKYVWDGGDFVLEASTGHPSLDARELDGDLLCFAKLADSWRFVLRDIPDQEWCDDDLLESCPIRMLDELGQCLHVFDDDVLAVAFSADGDRLLQLKADQLEIYKGSISQSPEKAFDLRPLHSALNLPDDTELWQRLACVYGIPAAVGLPNIFPCSATADANDILDQIHVRWLDDPPVDSIRSAIAEAALLPRLPDRIPLAE